MTRYTKQNVRKAAVKQSGNTKQNGRRAAVKKIGNTKKNECKAAVKKVGKARTQLRKVQPIWEKSNPTRCTSKCMSFLTSKLQNSSLPMEESEAIAETLQGVLDNVVEESDSQLLPVYPGGQPITFNVTPGTNFELVFAILRDLYQPLGNIINRQFKKVLKSSKNAMNLNKLKIVDFVSGLNRGVHHYQKNLRERSFKITKRAFQKKRDEFVNMSKEESATIMVEFTKNLAIPEPKKLNRCKAVPETYGELDLEQMGSIARELGIGPNDVFVDLGSGVGQLVCFMAAITGAKCVGIELAKDRADKAQKMGSAFRILASHLGKDIGSFDLFHGSFLDANLANLVCNEATVIFVNNFVFDSSLQNQMKEKIFSKCQNGTKIISTSSLISLRSSRTSKKAFTNFAKLIEGEPLTCLEKNMTWTDKTVQLYSAIVQKD